MRPHISSTSRRVLLFTIALLLSLTIAIPSEREKFEGVQVTLSKVLTVGELAELAYGTSKMWPLIAGNDSHEKDSILEIGTKIVVPAPEYCVFYMSYDCLQVADFMKSQNTSSSSSFWENNTRVLEDKRSPYSIYYNLVSGYVGFVQSIFHLSEVLNTPRIEKIFNYGLSINFMNDSPDVMANISIHTFPNQGNLLETPYQVESHGSKTAYVSDGGRNLEEATETNVIAGYLTFALRRDYNATYVFAFRLHSSTGKLTDAANILNGGFALIKPNQFPNFQPGQMHLAPQVRCNNFLHDTHSAGTNFSTKSGSGWKTFSLKETNDAFNIFLGVSGNVATLSIHYFHQHPFTLNSSLYYAIQSLSGKSLAIDGVATYTTGVRNFNFTPVFKTGAIDDKAEWILLPYDTKDHNSSSIFEIGNPHRSFFIINRFYGLHLKAISPTELVLAPFKPKTDVLEKYLWEIHNFVFETTSVFRIQNLFNDECFLASDDVQNTISLIPSSFKTNPQYETSQFFNLSARTPRIELELEINRESNCVYRIQRFEHPLMAILLHDLKWIQQYVQTNPKGLKREAFTIQNTTCKNKRAFTLRGIYLTQYIGVDMANPNTPHGVVDPTQEAAKWFVEKEAYNDNVYYFQNCWNDKYLTGFINPMGLSMNYTLETTKSYRSAHHLLLHPTINDLQ
jgi:hypothetical protein